jgi:hypothetical protein
MIGNKGSAEMGKPTVKLITFGGGGDHYREAAERLISQSKDFTSIDIRRAYTDADLHSDYYNLFNSLTGYGFYSWKPYLINAELSELELNDILVYIDAGCELNKRGIRRFEDYLSYTAKNDVLLFEMQHPNRFWTKNHPKLLGYPEHYFRNQLAATVIILKNNEQTKKLIKSWLDLCSYEGGSLLKDPDGNEPQIPGFMKHRCDQSCLSICAYLHNVTTIPDETWFPDWSYARNYPILALRNKTGIPILNKKLKINIFKRIKTFLKMLKA